MTRRCAILGTILAVACLFLLPSAALAGQPKNVIICIGDGMGFEQVKAARYYADAPMSFESFPYQGQMMTHSANASVTDSAAGGTAIATGVKVNNGVISMATPGDGSELETLLEYYQARGRSTGLVTTTYITHATPAAFGAHEPSRNNTSNIASDYLNQVRPNVLLGGGGYGMSTTSAAAAGYTVVTDLTGLNAPATRSASYVSGQFGSGYMPYEYSGSYGSLPHLSQMTSAALDILDDDPDGFFLMVEGGRIDHAGHSNLIRENIHETIEFSQSVQVILDWAAGRDDTLILVTADHETGGLTVLADNPGTYPTVSWSTGGHTGVNVPVYAWGPNAELVSGVIDNTDVFNIATVPEPATMGLLALGGMALLRRRRKATC